MSIIAMSDNSHPPFCASVLNDKNVEIGIIADNGAAYLAGIQPDQNLSVARNGQTQCSIHIPAALTENFKFNMLLPCLKK